MSVYEISYNNELKLFNGDSINLYLIYVAVIIEGAREARGDVWCVRGIFWLVARLLTCEKKTAAWSYSNWNSDLSAQLNMSKIFEGRSCGRCRLFIVLKCLLLMYCGAAWGIKLGETFELITYFLLVRESMPLNIRFAHHSPEYHCC
jgi:hypothetical protein